MLPNDLESTYADAAERVDAIVAGGGIPVVLGGDHAITYPVACAVPGPFTMIQIDAHLDYSPYEGTYRNSHAHPFRQVTELSHVERVLQVGIRSYRTLETDARDSLDAGNVIVHGRTVLEEGAEALAPHLVEGARVYVSFDVDVLDSCLVPGVSAAESGGLSPAQASDLLWSIAARCDIVAVDVCEVNPMLDLPSRPTAFIAVQLLVDLMGAIETANVTGRGAGTTGGER